MELENIRNKISDKDIFTEVVPVTNFWGEKKYKGVIYSFDEITYKKFIIETTRLFCDRINAENEVVKLADNLKSFIINRKDETI